MFKKCVIYIFCLIPWFLSSIIKVDYNYFKEIKTPFFTPPTMFYPIAWTIVYILIAITIYKIIIAYKLKEIPISYKIILLINYIFNQSFTLLFFGLKNNFLGFISCLGTFISTLFLYEETSLLQNKIKILLNPYILLSLFASILSLTIYLLNI